MVEALLTSDREKLWDILRMRVRSLANIMGVGILLAEDGRAYFHLIFSTSDKPDHRSDAAVKRAMVSAQVRYLRALRLEPFTAVAEMEGGSMREAQQDAFRALAGIIASCFYEVLSTQKTHNFAFFNSDSSCARIECDLGGR